MAPPVRVPLGRELPSVSVSSDLVIFASVKAFCHCFLPKVDELIRKPVLLAHTQHSEAAWMAGTTQGSPKISISILSSLWRSSASFVTLHTHDTEGCVSRPIYFLLVWEKNKSIGVETMLFFTAEPLVCWHPWPAAPRGVRVS